MNKKANATATVLITIGVILFLLLIFVGWIAGTYNSLVSIDVATEKAWGNVQTAYERRADLIPNLVNTVKGVVKFEQDTQTKIAQLRSGIKDAKTPDELDTAGQKMNSFVSDIIVSVEAYPDLKASQNFLALQDELAGTENRIKFERDNYNTAVQSYKTRIRSFPSNIIANMFGFDSAKWNMFQAEEESQEAPEVSF